MAALLEELKAGDELCVTFKSRRYDVYNVFGCAVLSSSVKTFMVGSRFIETNLRPDREVQSIRDTASAFGVIAAGDALDLDDAPEQLQLTVKNAGHGTIVRATFEHALHGRFTVTGPVVATEEDTIRAVGTWFLAQDGLAAPLLRKLKVIAPAGTHSFTVPKKITDWENDDESAER